MEYRRVGEAGLGVSALGFGSWVTFADQHDLGSILPLMQVARESGINHFDTAEGYAAGAAESMMGTAIKTLGWDREELVLSTKLYWGIRDSPNWQETLNRKYLMRSIDGCLRRLGTDYVDVLYCHRPDPNTPLEETIWAMSDIIADGKALYWGTSEWTPAQISRATSIANAKNLRAPIVEQSELNLSWKQKWSPLKEMAAAEGLGLVAWSPLASGLLTGKYRVAAPSGARGSMDSMRWMKDRLTSRAAADPLDRLEDYAAQLGATMSQVSIAWCLRQPHVCSVLLGASTLAQLEENLQALELSKILTDESLDFLDALFPTDLPRAE